MLAPELSPQELLRATSRSFYLTLRVLPGAIRPQIALAYLLARTADTIADTEIVPLEQRLDALQKLRERIPAQYAAPLNFGDLAARQGSPPEKLLLENVGSSLSAMQHFLEEDRKLIARVLTIITSGQELDLRRFTGSSAVKIIALETAFELDDYTFRVAGCVGEFWTRLCRAHLFPQARLEDSGLIADGIRFGKGLQLVNILRDLPADLKKGRCYLPAEKLEQFNLSPLTLLSPANEKKFLPLFQEYLDVAESHLRAGWRYTNTLPFGQYRLRLACAWPLLIGIRTIQKLRAASVLELRQSVKIPRHDVRLIILCSILACPIPVLWRNLFPGKSVASSHNLA